MNNIIVMPQNNQIIYTSNDDNIIEVCENIENLTIKLLDKKDNKSKTDINYDILEKKELQGLLKDNLVLEILMKIRLMLNL